MLGLVFTEEIKFDSGDLCKNIFPCYVVHLEFLKFYFIGRSELVCKNGKKAKQKYFRGLRAKNNGIGFGLRENKVSILHDVDFFKLE